MNSGIFFNVTIQKKKGVSLRRSLYLGVPVEYCFLSRHILLVVVFLLVLLFKYPIHWRFLRNLSLNYIFRCWKNCVWLFRFQDVLILESTLWLVRVVAVVWVVNGMVRSLCALGWTRRMIMRVRILNIKCCISCFTAWKKSVCEILSVMYEFSIF